MDYHNVMKINPILDFDEATGESQKAQVYRMNEAATGRFLHCRPSITSPYPARRTMSRIVVTPLILAITLMSLAGY